MSREIKKLSPAMQFLAMEFLDECRKASLDIIIICTDRNRADQEECFNNGSSNAHYGKSAHNVCDAVGNPASEAFDVGVIKNGKYVKDGKHPGYMAAGLIGERIGLKWAGRWKGRIQETAHFQNPNWETPAG